MDVSKSLKSKTISDLKNVSQAIKISRLLLCHDFAYYKQILKFKM